MRRRRSWVKTAIMGALLILATGYLGLSLMLPRWVRQQLSRVAGNTLTVGEIRLGFPLRLILSDVRLVSTNPGTMVSSHRIVASPLWLSWRHQTVWLQTVEFDGAYLQIRRTPQGVLLLPPWATPAQSESGAEAALETAKALAQSWPFPWQIVIQTIQVSDGAFEFVDQKPPQPFRGTLSHLSVVGGPLAIPPTSERIAIAFQAQVTGAQEHAAPVYCSGWVNLEGKALDLSCQLEPLRLSAFEPYYSQGPLQVRVYDATLKATSHLTAKANELEGRVQLEINNLSDADLSFQGTTLLDIKKVARGSERVLTGEIQIAGLLDRPREWRFQLVPGNEIVQRLVRPLLDRGVEIIRIKVGTQTIPVGLAPATEAVMSGIEAASQTVQETLEILTPTSPAPEAPTTEAPPEVTATAPEPLVEPPGTSPPPSPPQVPASPTEAPEAPPSEPGSPSPQ